MQDLLVNTAICSYIYMRFKASTCCTYKYALGCTHMHYFPCIDTIMDVHTCEQVYICLHLYLILHHYSFQQADSPTTLGKLWEMTKYKHNAGQISQHLFSALTLDHKTTMKLEIALRLEQAN